MSTEYFDVQKIDNKAPSDRVPARAVKLYDPLDVIAGQSVEPDSQIAWVDSQRTDDYVENGSKARPFKSFRGAWDSGKGNIFLIGRGQLAAAQIDDGPYILSADSHPNAGGALRIRGFTNETTIKDPYTLVFNGSSGIIVRNSGIRIDLEMQDTKIQVSGSNNHALTLDNALNRGTNVVLRNCELQSTQGYGLYIPANATTPSSNTKSEVRMFGSSTLASYVSKLMVEYDAAQPEALMEFHNTQFDALETTTEDLLRTIRLVGCRIAGNNVFSGGHVTQRIDAIYCVKQNFGGSAGITMLAPGDITSAHSTVVLPAS